MTATTLVAAAYVKLRAPSYDVYMVVAPANPLGEKGSSPLDLGAAASLLGVRANPGAAAGLDRYEEVMTSVELAKRVDPNGALFRRVFRSEWNEEDQKWAPSERWLPSLRRSLSQAFGGKPWHPPTAYGFARRMQNELAFAPVGRTNMRRITVRTPDPDLAVQLLSQLNEMADSIIRDGERARVTAYRDYLGAELPTVTNEENRRAISQLLLEQERQIMMLNAKTVSYAAQMIDPPSLPDQPNGPGPLTIIVASMIGGLFLGIGLIYFAMRPRRDVVAGSNYVERAEVEFPG